MSVAFKIEPSSGIPIYRQVIDQVTRLVASGVLKPGDELPSVRQVASEYEVNPMTISKAYSILEATDVLERLRGKGMIVAHNSGGVQTMPERLEQLMPALQEAANQATQLAIPKEKAIELFREILEERR